MAEWRLFDGDVPHVSTAEFHRDRERARHLEQPVHRRRLRMAAGFVLEAAALIRRPSVSDLGCGDGGLLSLIRDRLAARDGEAWGYDFAPANAAGWAERGVAGEQLDVFGADRNRVCFGDITVVTEVLEHIADPHGAVRWIREHSRFVVASSPWGEQPGHHDECHAWAWDVEGYQDLIRLGGFRIRRNELAGPFQVVLGERT